MLFYQSCTVLLQFFIVSKSLPLLSGITKFQYLRVAISWSDRALPIEDTSGKVLKPVLDPRIAWMGRKTLVWWILSLKACDVGKGCLWMLYLHTGSFCFLLCFSFPFFLCVYLVCELVLGSSPGVCKSFCHFCTQNGFEEGERQRASLKDRCCMTNLLSFGPCENVSVPVYPSSHD